MEYLFGPLLRRKCLPGMPTVEVEPVSAFPLLCLSPELRVLIYQRMAPRIIDIHLDRRYDSNASPRITYSSRTDEQSCRHKTADDRGNCWFSDSSNSTTDEVGDFFALLRTNRQVHREYFHELSQRTKLSLNVFDLDRVVELVTSDIDQLPALKWARHLILNWGVDCERCRYGYEELRSFCGGPTVKIKDVQKQLSRLQKQTGVRLHSVGLRFGARSYEGIILAHHACTCEDFIPVQSEEPVEIPFFDYNITAEELNETCLGEPRFTTLLTRIFDSEYFEENVVLIGDQRVPERFHWVDADLNLDDHPSEEQEHLDKEPQHLGREPEPR